MFHGTETEYSRKKQTNKLTQIVDKVVGCRRGHKPDRKPHAEVAHHNRPVLRSPDVSHPSIIVQGHDVPGLHPRTRPVIFCNSFYVAQELDLERLDVAPTLRNNEKGSGGRGR